MATLEQLWVEGTDILLDSGIQEAKLNAWYLLSEACGVSRTEYLLQKDKAPNHEQNERYLSWIAIRATHYPLEYIIGKQEFMGLTFQVNQDVLIPRQDTELLVEEVLKVSRGKEVLDMCTGSGCIAVSISKLGEPESVVGVDISESALRVAKENAKRIETNVTFIESSLFEKVSGTYDIIVSNPPYIESKVIETLMPEVREFEPRIALDGTEDGLYFYREITRLSPNYLRKNGQIFYEIGYNQGKAVKNILEEAGFQEVKVLKDLAGLDRIICAKWY